MSVKPTLLRRPWVPECIALFAVLWQEAVRLELRTAHRVLPISPRATAFYYYQFGDFVNGFLNAFLVDAIVDHSLSWRKPAVDTLRRTVRQRAVVASALSMMSIIGIELIPSAFNHADVGDIPAGIAGALLFLGVRMAAITWQ